MNNYFNKSWLRLIGWMMVASVIILSLVQIPSPPQSIPGNDKVLHLVTYFVLSYWFLHTYSHHKLMVISGMVFLGLLLEFLQYFTPHRFVEVLDMLMNTVGVLLAYISFGVMKIKIKCLLVR